MKEEIKRTVYLAARRARTNDHFRGIPISLVGSANQVTHVANAGLFQQDAVIFGKIIYKSAVRFAYYNFQTNFLRDLAVNRIEGITDLPGIKFISIIWTGLQ